MRLCYVVHFTRVTVLCYGMTLTDLLKSHLTIMKVMSNVYLRDKLLLQEPPIYLLLIAQSNKV